ncbi:RAD51-associated protein 1 [Pogona vitticeps]
MARPARGNKKAIDYSQFGDADDDDEDFANISAPSNKKSKRIRCESAKKKTEQQKQAHKEGSQLQKTSQIKRVALDDKLYQRDLEVALALSVNQSSVSNNKIQDLEEQALDDSTKDYNITEETFGKQVEISKQKLQTKDKVNGTNNYELELDSAEESENNSSLSEDDDNDEFVVKKKIKENKKGGTKLNIRSEKKIKKSSKSTRNLMVQAESKTTLQNACSSPELIGKPLKTSSPSTTKKPSWTPPGASGSGSNQLRRVPVKSPTQGLRLGLSRLAKVKPLHQSFVNS